MLTAAAASLITRLIGFALLMGGAPAVDMASGVSLIENLATSSSPASEARVAAPDPLNVAVGWCVAAGDEAGVYLRLRSSLVWNPAPLRVTGSESVNPRDLALAFDSTGAIHLVWTDLDKGHRRVYYTALDRDLAPLRGPEPVSPGSLADADYPQIGWDDSIGALIVWQAAQAGRYSVQSLALNAETLDAVILESPSGADRTAMSPQIVSMNPATVAWHEILDSSAKLRLARLGGDTLSWESWVPGGLDAIEPANAQPMIRLTPGGVPVLCWSEESAGGPSAIRVARGDAAGSQVFDNPVGDHRQPQLVVSGDDRGAVAWQVFSGGAQSVEAADVKWSGGDATGVRVSPPAHRFASDPSHDGRSDWSVVVWTDDLLDGGSGAVGFAEIHWDQR